jgi:hypothetical protein
VIDGVIHGSIQHDPFIVIVQYSVTCNSIITGFKEIQAPKAVIDIIPTYLVIAGEFYVHTVPVTIVDNVIDYTAIIGINKENPFPAVVAGIVA